MEEVITTEDFRAIAISDTHLGYEYTNPKFFDFLKEFEDIASEYDIEYFLLLGDIFDLWRRDMAGVFIQFHDVLKRLKEINEKVKVILIAGNHDWHLVPEPYALGNVYKYPDPFNWKSVVEVVMPKRCYIFLHGHQFDPKCRNPIVNNELCYSNDNQGKMMSETWKKSKVVSVINSMSYGIPFNFIDILDYLTEPGFAFYKKEHIRRTAEKSRKRHYDYIVFGHTHHAYVSSNSANTGCWVKEKSDFLVIENYKVKLEQY